MDMIYADANLVDQGVLQDYSFDEVYGYDENTFECKVQKYNHVCDQDYILYVEFTEYGGIIDRIESDVKTGVITYSGRTWHGVLNSFVIEPLAGYAHRTYRGEINEVLAQMISDIGMGSLFVVDIVTDGDIEIEPFEVRYEKAYDAMLRMCAKNQCKILMYYYDGKVHIGAVYAVNYATNEEFDSSQVPFKVGYTYNNVNHLVCLGKGDDVDRAVIHIFADDTEGEDGTQLYVYPNVVTNPTGSPIDNHYYEKDGNKYFKSDDDTVEAGKTYYAKRGDPKQDSDYILDKSQQEEFDREERAEILDLPNSEYVYNYLPLNTEPTNWKGTYLNYYKPVRNDDGKLTYEKLKEVRKDEYFLTQKEPTDWKVDKGYQDYYYWNAEKDPQWYIWDDVDKSWIKANEGDEGAVLKAGGLVNVKAITEGVTYDYTDLEELGGQPPDWESEYGSYYQQKGSSEWEQAQGNTFEWYGDAPSHGDGVTEPYYGNRLTTQPPDWDRNFADYYTYKLNALQKREFYNCDGIQHYLPKKITSAKAPAKWQTEWGSYYVVANAKIKKAKKIEKLEGKYVTASVAEQNGQLQKVKDKNYVAYKKDKFYMMIQQPDTAKAFSSFTRGVFEKHSRTDPPNYVAHRYYFRKTNDFPTWTPNTYYRKEEDKIQIPTWVAGGFFYQVVDRYANLVKSAIEKLKTLRDTSSLDISLELESNYDVGDTVGSEDQVTNISVNRVILRKIIKIKKDIVSIDYEVE